MSLFFTLIQWGEKSTCKSSANVDNVSYWRGLFLFLEGKKAVSQFYFATSMAKGKMSLFFFEVGLTFVKQKGRKKPISRERKKNKN